MPSTRHVSKEQHSPNSVKGQNKFIFPSNNHILVTTPSHIYAWDALGVHTIFKSSKSSIVAAREAKDGSGVLAVADKHVVVLHDTKHGQERSWGLNADEDEVRHLEYTADAKLLFLSTNLTTDIQRYSTQRSRLLEPSRAHATPPIALAVSPTGHLLVSASDNPPAVYLKDLKQNGTPTLIEPQASETAVSTISFHPERPNVFLLAFRDGTVASFDATKISRSHGGQFANQEKVNSGEISRLPRLHRTTSQIINSSSISDAAFVPGYKTRAITTGSDGRCRLIDFADGGIVLRTWHAKAPVTSISILSQKSESEVRTRNLESRRSHHVIGGLTSTNNLVVIGRADGKIHIYDSLGLLLDQDSFGKDDEKIISVEWAKGRSPKSISNSIMSRNVDDISKVVNQKDMNDNKTEQRSAGSQAKPSAPARRETLFEHVGLPPALRKPKDVADPATTQLPRRFTIHPDEIDEGTVRHNPASRPAQAVPVDQKDYLDLFSPVKLSDEDPNKSPARRLASPPRFRPRVSPQTFVKNPDPAPPGQHNSISRQRNLALFPSTDSTASNITIPAANKTMGIPTKLPARQGTKITFKPASQRRVRNTTAYRINKPSPNQNAKVLADLRKLGATQAGSGSSGTLISFAPAKPDPVPDRAKSSSKKCALSIFHRPTNHVETDLDSLKALKMYEHVHHKVNWPEDSNQEPSLDGDIWFTSDSGNETTRQRRQSRYPVQRPPARQTLRSQVNSKGTMSTIGQNPTAAAAQQMSDRAIVDGSTEDGMETAHTHMSPSGAFSPSSTDVRNLFPRTSSLSPKKRKRPRKQFRAAPESPIRPLREVSLNALATRQAKSPWARVKAGQYKQDHKDTRQANQRNIADHENQPHCDICMPTRLRVNELEEEMAHLKGDVIALKAVLRRNGIPVPLSTR